MKDYAAMSDFEINCEALSVFSPCIKHMCLSADNSCFYDCGPTGDGWYQIGIPDYCNNPADAWPIIIGSMISVRPVGGDGHLWEASGMEGMKADYDKNPLRSAMIVFLMMKDGEL